MLSYSGEFVPHGRSGWTLAEVELSRFAGDFSAALSDHLMRDVLDAWAAEKLIPRETDSALLVGARERLGRDLDDGERSHLRFDFLEALRHVPLSVTEVEAK